MKAKHTSGPLLAIDCGNHAEWEVVKFDVEASNGHWFIAQCFGEPDDGTAKANAHLFAAAPELLEALENAMGILGRAESNASGNPEWDHVGPRVAAARAAIAKARGEA